MKDYFGTMSVNTEFESTTLPDYPQTMAQILDLENPRSPVNLCPEPMREQIITAFYHRPKLFSLDEKSLHDLLILENKKPTATDNRLRMKFWLEYDRVVSPNQTQNGYRTVSPSIITSGVCSTQFFTSRYLKYPEKVAWMLTVPTTYQVLTEEALIYGLDQLRDILAMDNYLEIKGGKKIPNVKLLELKAKIVTMLDMRIMGGHTQRIEQKSMNLQITANNTVDISKTMETSTMDQIEEKLKMLQLEEAKLLNGGLDIHPNLGKKVEVEVESE